MVAIRISSQHCGQFVRLQKTGPIVCLPKNCARSRVASKEEAKRKPSPEELEEKVLQFLSAPLEAPPTK
jgi:hypothetical protein